MRIAICLLLFSSSIISLPSCSKKSNTANEALPLARINNVSGDRGITDVIFQFNVSLDKAPVTNATIDYTTVAASAEENKDYKPVSGALTIPSG